MKKTKIIIGSLVGVIVLETLSLVVMFSIVGTIFSLRAEEVSVIKALMLRAEEVSETSATKAESDAQVPYVYIDDETKDVYYVNIAKIRIAESVLNAEKSTVIYKHAELSPSGRYVALQISTYESNDAAVYDLVTQEFHWLRWAFGAGKISWRPDTDILVSTFESPSNNGFCGTIDGIIRCGEYVSASTDAPWDLRYLTPSGELIDPIEAQNN